MTLECSLAIIRDSDKLLYSLRAKHPYHGYYEFPGGKVEKNETPEDALYRECFEELGIKVTKFSSIGSVVHYYDHLHLFCFLHNRIAMVVQLKSVIFMLRVIHKGC